MKVAIHQPQYFPWPPYLHKAMTADVFVYLDTVQFNKNGLQNRNRIKTAQGPKWLTIPIKQLFGQRIQETAIADSRATMKHWKTIVANYSRSAGFVRWRDELQDLLDREFVSLCDIAIASTEWMLSKLNARSRRIRASDINGLQGEASRMVASVCQALGASTYFTGTGAMAYLDPRDFADIKCEIVVQNWQPFTYDQLYPEVGFVSDLSTIDLLLNCPDMAESLITSAGGWLPLHQQ